MLLKIATPMEQDPTIDSSDSRLTASSNNKMVLGNGGNRMHQERQYLAELPTMPSTGSAMNYGRTFYCVNSGLQNEVMRPDSLNLQQNNRNQNLNQQDRADWAGMDIDSPNNLDISNIPLHEFPHEKMNISAVSAMKLHNRRPYRDRITTNDTSDNCDGSSITESKMVHRDLRKTLNVESSPESDESDYRQCFSDIDGNCDSDGNYKDPAECTNDSFDIPDYQGNSSSCTDTSDSMTHLKQMAQTGLDGFESPVCISSEDQSSNDSITCLKQAAFYLDSNQSSERSRGSTLQEAGKMAKLKSCDSISNLRNTCCVNRNGNSMFVQSDFCVGQLSSELFHNGNTHDSFGSPVYSSGGQDEFDIDGPYGLQYDLQTDGTELNCLPPYLDFNKYPQSNSDPQIEDQDTSKRQKGCTYNLPKQKAVLGQFRASQSQENTPSECRGQLNPQAYEKLNLTPPSDQEFCYEPNLGQSENNTSPDIPTIADVFTPVDGRFRLPDFNCSRTTNSRLQDFNCSGSTDSRLPDFNCSGSTNSRLQDYNRSGSTDSGLHTDLSILESTGQKRSTQSTADQLAVQKKTRHTVSGQESQHVHFEEEHELASRRHSSPLTSMQRQCPSIQPVSNCSWKPALPPRTSRNSFKQVLAGSSSRQSLDSLLAKDKLFCHYNATLRNCSGWSPKETDNTVSREK